MMKRALILSTNLIHAYYVAYQSMYYYSWVALLMSTLLYDFDHGSNLAWGLHNFSVLIIAAQDIYWSTIIPFVYQVNVLWFAVLYGLMHYVDMYADEAHNVSVPTTLFFSILHHMLLFGKAQIEQLNIT